MPSLVDVLLLEPYRITTWIAYRTDSVKGTGTQADPWDGSTKFGAAVSVTNLSNSVQEATATTGSAHGYSNNDVVNIDGVTGAGAAQWNGTFLIYGVTSTTFKYYMNATPAAAAGGLPVGASKVIGYRFDEIMSTLGVNTTVHLGPTTANRPFLTKGYRDGGGGGWQAKLAMKIVGSGIDVTTIRLVGQAMNGTYYAIGHDFAGGTVDYFEVSDLTIDANLMIPTANSSVCGAVRVMGNHARVRRIKAINWGANAVKPLFVVSVVTADPDLGFAGVSDCGIEEVIAISPASSAANAPITALHAGPRDDVSTTLTEGYGIGPFIRNCFVDCGSPTAAPEYRGLSMAWCKAGIVEGNQVHNTKFGGPYINYSSSRDLAVRFNVYKNVFKGPYWNLGTLGSSYGSGSLARSGTVATVTVTAGHYLSIGDRVKIVGTPSNFDGIHQVTGTSGNTFTFDTSVTAASSATLTSVQRVYGVDKLAVEGNTVELATETSGELIGVHVHDAGLTGQDPVYPAYPFGDVVVRDNKVRYLNGAFQTSPAYTGYGIQVNGARNLVVQDNLVECVPVNPIRNRRCGSLEYFNNRTPGGVLIQGYNEDNTTRYDELETDAEDALVLALFSHR